MASINQFSLYSMNGNLNTEQKEDQVDVYIRELTQINDYNEVMNYVQEKFGDISGNKMFEYPEIKKQINVFTEKNRVEICAAKEYQQYWGKGWFDKAAAEAEK